MMWILIQYPQLGKGLNTAQQELMLLVANQRSTRAGLLMQDLLGLCKEVPEEINFAVFQNSLMSSPIDDGRRAEALRWGSQKN